MENFNQSEIFKNFSRAADTYTEHATLQKEIAVRLARALEPWQYSVPEGPGIEVGCGTGIFTEHLLQTFPKKELQVTDAVPGMVKITSHKFKDVKNVKFEVLDAENAEWEENKYSLIVGNFVAHWFKHPALALTKMTESLIPGGFLLMSLPGSESFPQWRKYCVELGLPFTANQLPDIEQMIVNLSMGPTKVDFYEDQSSITFDSLYSFYDHLKKTGYNTSFKKSLLTPKQLSLLNNHWLTKNGGELNVYIHTAFIAVKRDL